MTEQPTPAVLDRIRRLRALTEDDSTTQHERDLAAERAAMLMKRHEVTPAQVDEQSAPRPAPTPQPQPHYAYGPVVFVQFTGSNTSYMPYSTGYTIYWR